MERALLLGGHVPGPARGRVLEQDRGRDAHVQALDEAPHGHADAPPAGGDELLVDAIPFVAEHQAKPRDLAKILGRELSLGVGGDELVSGGGEGLERVGARRIRPHVDPLLGALRDLAHGEKRDPAPLDDVELVDAKRITRPQDGGAVVRVVGRIHEHGDSAEAGGEDRIEAGLALGREEGLERAYDRGVIEAGEPSEEALLRELDLDGMGSPAAHRGAGIARWGRKRKRRREAGLPKRVGIWDARRMWRRVELRNYRSIEHVKVDLAPFTLLVGPNGSGKSNFADALVFVRDVATDAETAVERRGGIADIRRWRPTKPADVAIDVRAAPSQAALELSYLRHQFTIHSGREGKWSFRREHVEAKGAPETQFSLKRDQNKLTVDPSSPKDIANISSRSRAVVLSEKASAMVLARQLTVFSGSGALRKVRRVHLNPEAMRQPQPATENTRLDETGKNIAPAYGSLKPSAKEEVVAAMRKIVPGLSTIDVEPLDRFLLLKFVQHQRGDERATFSASAMSEGALRALGILVAAQQITADELLIIEEPEIAIHVGAAQLLFDVLKRASRRGAVLVTTHSADLLDAAKDEEILVCAYRDGVTKIGPLASEQRAVVKDGLFSVSELMRSEPLRIEGEPIPTVEP